MSDDVRAGRIREGMELARERNGMPTRGRPCPWCSTVIESLAVETFRDATMRVEALPCRHQWLWTPTTPAKPAMPLPNALEETPDG